MFNAPNSKITKDVRDKLGSSVESLDDLRGTVQMLCDIIGKQNEKINSLEWKCQRNTTRTVANANSLENLAGRVDELEKYSRKLCLIFNNLDHSDSP